MTLIESTEGAGPTIAGPCPGRAILPRGWYIIEAEFEILTGSSPVPLRLERMKLDGVTDMLSLPSCQQGAKWQGVFTLDEPCIAVDLQAAGPDPVRIISQQVHRAARASALAAMLKAVAAHLGRPMAVCRLIATLLWTCLVASPRGAVQDLARRYREIDSEHFSVRCQLRHSAWPRASTWVRLEPGGDLHGYRKAAGKVGWLASGGDPQLQLSPASLQRPLPGGWYMFRASVKIEAGELHSPSLYLDYGDGLAPDCQLLLPGPDASGLIRAVVLLKRDVVQLRFDPSMREARFEFEKLQLLRMTRAAAALAMLDGMREEGWQGWQAMLRAAREAASMLFAQGASRAGEVLYRHYWQALRPDASSYESWVRMYDTFSPAGRAKLAARAATIVDGPLISILVPVYQTPERWLRRCIESVLGQAYPNWELCLADDASPSPRVQQILREFAARDPRIRVCFRKVNGHIADASNSALAMARGDFIGLLDHDDELRPHALLEMVESILQQPQARFLYSDEDKIDEHGRRFDPYFKPDWNPDLLLAQNYLCHFTVIERALTESVGGFRTGFEGSQDHDLFLRCVHELQPGQIVHVPRILYHWRAIAGSTALRRDAKDYAAGAGVLAVKDHIARTGAEAAVEQLPHGHYRVRWALPTPAPLVSLIIPTRDKVHLLRTCIDSILHNNRYPALELIVIDNQSSEPETLDYLSDLRSSGQATVLSYDLPFNYSAINNFAVSQARGSVIGLLNNDIEVTSGDWLPEMVAQAMRPHIGAVGAMLYYPDGSIQHAGVILGIGGIANHPYMHQPRGYPGHGGRALVAQNLSAVTGACLLVRRESYERCGGLDEGMAVAFNDVDFCLRLGQLGLRNLWTPFAELVHHESASRGIEDTDEKRRRFEQEVDFMRCRWGAQLFNDPAYNPNLSLETINFELAFPPRHALRPEV